MTLFSTRNYSLKDALQRRVSDRLTATVVKLIILRTTVKVIQYSVISMHTSCRNSRRKFTLYPSLPMSFYLLTTLYTTNGHYATTN